MSKTITQLKERQVLNFNRRLRVYFRLMINLVKRGGCEDRKYARFVNGKWGCYDELLLGYNLHPSTIEPVFLTFFPRNRFMEILIRPVQVSRASIRKERSQ